MRTWENEQTWVLTQFQMWIYVSTKNESIAWTGKHICLRGIYVWKKAIWLPWQLQKCRNMSHDTSSFLYVYIHPKSEQKIVRVTVRTQTHIYFYSIYQEIGHLVTLSTAEMKNCGSSYIINCAGMYPPKIKTLHIQLLEILPRQDTIFIYTVYIQVKKLAIWKKKHGKKNTDTVEFILAGIPMITCAEQSRFSTWLWCSCKMPDITYLMVFSW